MKKRTYNRLLSIAKAKVEYYKPLDLWAAHLMAVEVFMLINIGYKLNDSSNYKLEYLKDHINRGEACTTWTFFSSII